VEDAGDVVLGIVAPDGRDGMWSHVQQFANADIPFIFDPGQGLPLFSGPELLEMIDAATYVAVNDYEARLVTERTGMNLASLARRVEALIVTRGAEGSEIHTDGCCIHIPNAMADTLVDPTGCGDAYRAGLLYGIAEGWDWERTGRLASTLGALKIGARGGQNHAVSREAVAALHRRSFGDVPW
jgi:adenosine kinase